MTDRLSLLEGRVGSQADYLDDLATAIRALQTTRDVALRDELEGRLSPALSVRMGDLSGGLGARSNVATSLGNTEPYTGRVNALDDPTFDGWPAVNVSVPSASILDLGRYWETWYTLNSGTAPTFVTVLVEERGTTGAPLNSSAGRYQIDWGAATGSVTITLRSTAPQPSIETALPYIVGAIRFAEAGISTPSDFTISAVLYTINAAGSVAASSPVTDLRVLGLGESLRIHAAEQVAGGAYNRRIEVRVTVARVATTGGVAQVNLYLGDPQLHTAYTPDPIPYAPLLGKWYPARLAEETALLEAASGSSTTASGWWRITGIPGTAHAGLAFRVAGESFNRVEIAARSGAPNDPAFLLRGVGVPGPNAGAEVIYQMIEFRQLSASDYPLMRIAAVQPTGGFEDAAEIVLSTGVAGSWREGLRLRSHPIFEAVFKGTVVADAMYSGSSIQAAGPVQASGYNVNAIQVVGARRAGWGVPTGTATRTTFATSTVTLPQLAERVKALLDDLHSPGGHGLIGG